MKKFLFVFVAVLASLVSCQNAENLTVEVTPEVKGVPMTLKASIKGDFGTKVTYNPGEPTGLKVDWDATETISVVTLTGSGQFLSSDTFTSTGVAGRPEAEFTGTFTGGATPAQVLVIYPALEQYSSGYYGTPEYTTYLGTTSRLLSGIYNDGADIYADSHLSWFTQTADNSTSHLQNVMLMVGAADIDDIKTGVLTTTLENQLSIIKIKCTFNELWQVGRTINSITIDSKDASDKNKSVFHSTLVTWDYINLTSSPLSLQGSSTVHETAIKADFVVPESRMATLYLPVLFKGKNVATDYWNITVQLDISGTPSDRPVIKKTFASDKTFERGKMYTVSVDVD